MNDALDNYRRWAAADASERDDDADAALQGLQAVESETLVSPEFTTRTMTAIADAAARDARHARRARVAVLSGTAVATAAALHSGAGWAFPDAFAAFLGLLNLLVAAVVRTAEAFQSGAGVWGVLLSLGRATSVLAADSSVTFAMIAISAVAIAALVALQRLLGSDEESFQ